MLAAAARGIDRNHNGADLPGVARRLVPPIAVKGLRALRVRSSIPAMPFTFHHFAVNLPPCPSSSKSKTSANTTASASSAAAPGAKTSDGWAKARGRPDPLLKIAETDHGHRVGGERCNLASALHRVC